MNLMSTKRKVRCGKYHAGNQTLHRQPGGWYECAGCGALYEARDVKEAPTGDFAGQGKAYIPNAP